MSLEPVVVGLRILYLTLLSSMPLETKGVCSATRLSDAGGVDRYGLARRPRRVGRCTASPASTSFLQVP